MTACVTINASGGYFKPLVILKNKKTMKGLESFTRIHFSSSSTGWMNRRIFFWWCLIFITEVSYYRLTLPAEIRDKTILLILDGHSSRLSFYPMLLLWIFKIDCLLIPSHCSHILQPFDTGIGSPLNAAFTAIMNLKQFSNQMNNFKILTSELRCMMISSFEEAMHRVCYPDNIRSAFCSAGLVPFDPYEALKRQYVLPESINSPTDNGFSGRIINSIDMLSMLFEKEKGRKMMDSDLQLSMSQLKFLVMQHQSSTYDGFGLSGLPPLFILKNDNQIRIENLMEQ